jgi:hypothetical protein
MHEGTFVIMTRLFPLASIASIGAANEISLPSLILARAHACTSSNQCLPRNARLPHPSSQCLLLLLGMVAAAGVAACRGPHGAMQSGAQGAMWDCSGACCPSRACRWGMGRHNKQFFLASFLCEHTCHLHVQGVFLLGKGCSPYRVVA